jgi:hypothetical protein
MPATIREDALAISKLIREAEAVTDEAMIACARLKQAMVRARQNPEIAIDAGQRALMRLTQAETQALAMSTSLLRVHDELSKVARETMGVEDGQMDTNVQASAIAAMPALIVA